MSVTHAPQIDERGTEHRWGCGMSGWLTRASSVPGFTIMRCSGCGVVRLVRAGSAQPTKGDPR